VSYLVYFLGPVALAIIGANALRQRYRVVVIGMIAFLVAWTLCQAIASGAAAAFHLNQRTFAFGVVAALAAGFIEEITRYIVFRRAAVFQDNRTWRASLTYALGHHGMETIIVGLTLVLIALVLRFRPDAIGDPTTLADCRAADALGGGAKLYAASERLAVGLLVHACFSGVVMLSVLRHQVRWLWVAIGWHVAHDLVAFNVHRLADHWIVTKAWVLVVVIGYSYLAVRIYRALQPPVPAVAPLVPVGPPPMILPGRSV
jgi:uncharacterized membrane protein YhfC